MPVNLHFHYALRIDQVSEYWPTLNIIHSVLENPTLRKAETFSLTFLLYLYSPHTVCHTWTLKCSALPVLPAAFSFGSVSTVIIFWGPKYSKSTETLEEHQQHAHTHLSDLFCFAKFTTSETPYSQTTEWWWHQVDDPSRQGNKWTVSQLTLTPAHFVITWGRSHSTT